MPGILPRPAVAFRLILRPQGWPGGRGCGGVLQGIGPARWHLARLRVARWHIPARCPGPESVAGIGGGHIPAAVVLILTARRESVAVAVPD